MFCIFEFFCGTLFLPLFTHLPVPPCLQLRGLCLHPNKKPAMAGCSEGREGPFPSAGKELLWCLMEWGTCFEMCCCIWNTPWKACGVLCREGIGYLTSALLNPRIGGDVNSVQYCMAKDLWLFAGCFTYRRYWAARGDWHYHPVSVTLLTFLLDVLCSVVWGVVHCILEMVYLHRKAEFVPEPFLCISFCSWGWNLIIFFSFDHILALCVFSYLPLTGTSWWLPPGRCSSGSDHSEWLMYSSNILLLFYFGLVLLVFY